MNDSLTRERERERKNEEIYKYIYIYEKEKREMKDRRNVRLNTIIGKLILEYVLIMSFKQVLDSIMS